MSAPREKVTVTLSPEYEALRAAIEELARAGLPADAREVYSGRNRIVAFTRNGISLSVKAFAKPGWLRSLIYGTCRPSKAHRSYLNARRLVDLGFHTPAPVAFIEVYSGRRLTRSYYVCLHIDAEPIYRHEMRGEFPALAPLLASEMALLHQKGVFMHDFTAGNILVDTSGAAPVLCYVDLNRISFGRHSRRLLRRMLNSPLYGDHDIAMLLPLYAEAASLPQQQVQREARQARRRYNLLKHLSHPLRYLGRKPR